MSPHRSGIRAAQAGLLVNAVLAGVKLLAGIFGHSYALVADAMESTADMAASLVVWGGLAIAAQPADDNHPYGHGKAEALAAAVVALMLVAAAGAIAVEAVREIRTPHHLPAPWTLAVLGGVMLVKWGMSRRVGAVGAATGSTAVRADAGHHLSDALTSGAAFVGIVTAIVGHRLYGGRDWAAADDWAALLAAAVVAYNGVRLLRPALDDLMDHMPPPAVVDAVARAARAVPRVCDVEKVHVRRHGVVLYVDIHVQSHPRTPLDEAHVISGMVKAAIRGAVPAVRGVLVHMEPYEGQIPEGAGPVAPAPPATRGHG